LATQRITIAKVGGVAAEVILRLLREWSEARITSDPETWASTQWPADIRRKADTLSDRLRANSCAPPVVYFAEWVDMWSMGDQFRHWLAPPDGPPPFVVHADQFEVYAAAIPDGGRLARHLANAGPRQHVEQDWYVRRLREAVEAWGQVVERAVIVVLRQVIEGSVTDEEMRVSLDRLPGWLLADPRGVPDTAGEHRGAIDRGLTSP
jgi:hypothetical protein